jgi:hypothetical protein
VPQLNEDLSHEKGNRPAKPSGKFQFFRGLHSLWAVNSEGMQDIHKNAEEYKGRGHDITPDHPFLMLLNTSTTYGQVPRLGEIP